MFLRNNRLVEASNAFKRAVHEDSSNAKYLSYLGLTVALLEKDIPKATKLCRASIDHSPFDPELYFNLSRVYHLAGQRVKALKTLRDGLGYEEDSPLLLMGLRRMGVRRIPPFRFLRREHLLNKVFGKLTYKFSKAIPKRRSKDDTSAPQDSAWIEDSIG